MFSKLSSLPSADFPPQLPVPRPPSPMNIPNRTSILAVALGFLAPLSLEAASTVPTPTQTSILQQLDTYHRTIRPDGGEGRVANHPSQQWRAQFDARGFMVTPDSGSWTWGLQLESFGLTGSELTLSGKAEVNSAGQTVEYKWSHQLTEWFVNDPRGLEHGFTVHSRPPGNETEMRFNLRTRGGLAPNVHPDRQAITFQGTTGSRHLNYSGLKAWDADGQVLRSWFEASGDGNFSIVVDVAEAKYPLTIDPLAQQAYLKAPNSGAGDGFGYSVATDGDLIVVGAPNEDSNASGVNGDGSNDTAPESGAAYVFRRVSEVWVFEAYLKASNPGAGDNFGANVAVSGNTIVVGAEFEDGLGTGVNPPANDLLSNSGAAYIFTFAAGSWTQTAYLKASNAGVSDQFGSAVAISGNKVLVTAVLEDSNATDVGGNQANNTGSNSGAAYIFSRTGLVWSQEAYLKASNTAAGDFFGFSAALAGNVAVIGATQEDSAATGVNGDGTDNSAAASGAAYVYVLGGGGWAFDAYLKASNTGASDNFGASVAASGTTILVGAPGEDSSATGIGGNEASNSLTGSGACYAFEWSGGVWAQQAYIKASNSGAGDAFGGAVAANAGVAVVGAPMEDSNAVIIDGLQSNNAAPNSGAAYSFLYSASSWGQEAYLKPKNTGSSDGFGASVATSDGLLLVGAALEDSISTAINTLDADNSSPDSGAAYTFDHILGMDPVVLLNDPAPGMPIGANFGGWLEQYLNDAGAVVIRATTKSGGVAPGNDEGAWTDSTGVLSLIAREGDPVLGGAPGEVFASTFINSRLSNAGTTLLNANATLTGTPAFNELLCLADDGASVTVAAREGPDFDYVSPGFGIDETQTRGCFNARLSAAGGGTPSTDTGIWNIDASSGTYTEVVREGFNLGGTTVMGQVTGRVVGSRTGNVAYNASLNGVPLNAGSAIFTQEATAPGSPLMIVQKGASAPGGGLFNTFLGESLNPAGSIVFEASLAGAGVTTADNEGLYTNFGGTLKLVLRKGDTVDGGQLLRIDRHWLLTDGTVIAQGLLTGAGVTAANDGIVIRVTPAGTASALLREGQSLAQLQNSVISVISAFNISANGHYMASATLVSGTGNATAANNLTVVKGKLGVTGFNLVVRKGDVVRLDGAKRTVYSVKLGTATTTLAGGTGGQGRVINDNGQMVLAVYFADTTQGVFVNPVP